MKRSPAATVLAWGTGGLNIDGCRVGDSKNVPASVSRGLGGASLSGSVDGSLRRESGSEAGHNPNIGRFPANLIHDGSPEVLACFPDSDSKGGGGKPQSGYWGHAGQGRDAKHGDSGSAARFFYAAKSSKSDRGPGNDHPTVKPRALIRYLCRMVTPPGGITLDLYGGSGTSGLAAMDEGLQSILVEKEAHHIDIIKSRLQEELDNVPEQRSLFA